MRVINKKKFNKKYKKLKAFTLIELMVAIALFTIFTYFIGSFSIDSLNATKNSAIRNKAIYKLIEVQNAIAAIKNDMWTIFKNENNSNPKHLVFIDDHYEIVDGVFEEDDITYSFTINNVERDVNGNIVESGGTIDNRTKLINLIASWNNINGLPVNINTKFYVNDWNTIEILDTTKAQFDSGSYIQTRSTLNEDGEVSLQQIFFPDWCKPTLGLNEYDIPGDATAKTLFSYIGETYLGTGGNSNGVAFTKLTIQGVDNPVINVEGEFNGYLTNNIFVDGDYAYLATTNDSKEVVILDISTLPYSEIGYFNTSRKDDANSVYVVGNVGYVAAGKYVYSFDLSSKTGSRSALGSRQVSLNQNWGVTSSVSQIVVRGNYLFASLDQDWYELSIVNVTNPSNMSITSQTSVNNQQTFDIYVSMDSNRTYFGTGNSSSEREFFILDTSSKSGSRPIIGRYDTNGMSVKGIAIIEEDKRAILVGTGGEEYQTVNISNESSPVRCGGMQLNSGINDVDSVRDSQSNSFSYILTNDNQRDFQILRGGPGLGGDDDGFGYPSNGEYISRVLNTESSSVYYYYLEFGGSIPSGTGMKLQIRASNSSDLSTELWRGPNGSTDTYFEGFGAIVIDEYFSNKQYIQYRVLFESNTLSSPVLNYVRLNYQK